MLFRSGKVIYGRSHIVLFRVCFVSFRDHSGDGLVLRSARSIFRKEHCTRPVIGQYFARLHNSTNEKACNGKRRLEAINFGGRRKYGAE